jgi:hypothetical protein
LPLLATGLGWAAGVVCGQAAVGASTVSSASTTSFGGTRLRIGIFAP